jgi:hypothetical protein
VDLSSS